MSDTQPRQWRDYVGAWIGIGTSPGSLIMGAGIAARHHGPIPLYSILIALVLMATILWFQGSLGMPSLAGAGGNLKAITSQYFGLGTQKGLGALIAVGMIGWYAFNVGLGGAAFSALFHWPAWIGILLLGLPILILSLNGIQGWNRLAGLTTVSVIVLTIIVVLKLADNSSPVTMRPGPVGYMIADVAVLVGYISVFTVRAPDFSAYLADKKQLSILILFMCLPVIGVMLAGIALQQGTGSDNLVKILAAPDGLPFGNLLVTLSVIAPSFTILYSGAPALQTATGIRPKSGMVLITTIGLILAILRFDLYLGAWLSMLSAMLPPLVVPLAVESHLRRRGKAHKLIPLSVWVPGSVLAVILTVFKQPIAQLAGLSLALILTIIWQTGGDTRLQKRRKPA